MLGFIVSEVSIDRRLQPGLFTLGFDSVTPSVLVLGRV